MHLFTPASSNLLKISSIIMSIQSFDIGSPSILGYGLETDLTIPLALTDLQTTRHLFVRKTSDGRLDGKNGFTRYFDIIGTHGMRIFQGIERTPKEHRMRRGQKNFYVVIFDARGGEVFDFHGQIGKIFEAGHNGQKWGGIYERLYHDKRFVYPVVFHKPEGKPTQQQSNIRVSRSSELLRKSRPIIDDGKVNKGEVLFIVGDQYENNVGCCGCNLLVPESRMRKIGLDIETSLYLPDRATKVGRVSKSWNSADMIKCNPNDIKDTLGVHFPKRADIRIKAILLGALFMLDDQLYEPMD